MTGPDRDELEAIRNLVREADEYCREAAAVRARIESRMQQAPLWPERGDPRRWESPAAATSRDVSE